MGVNGYGGVSGNGGTRKRDTQTHSRATMSEDCIRMAGGNSSISCMALWGHGGGGGIDCHRWALMGVD